MSDNPTYHYVNARFVLKDGRTRDTTAPILVVPPDTLATGADLFEVERTYKLAGKETTLSDGTRWIYREQ
jgi:hypothetical protein